jgi:hypothetical protein
MRTVDNQQLALWRQQRRQQETAEYAQQIRNDHAETTKSRNEALERGDNETAAMLDDDLIRIEGEYRDFVASQPVQADPRQVEFMRRVSPFIKIRPAGRTSARSCPQLRNEAAQSECEQSAKHWHGTEAKHACIFRGDAKSS